jgi:hypothetical protein
VNVLPAIPLEKSNQVTHLRHLSVSSPPAAELMEMDQEELPNISPRSNPMSVYSDEELDPELLASLEQVEKSHEAGVILPDSYYKQIWNWAWLALSFLEFWLITVTMSCYNNFLQEHAQPLEVAFYIFNTCFFGLDMFIQSRTAYRTPGGTIQDDRKTIQRNYLRRGLAVDLIMVIPWALLLLPSMQPAAWQLGRVTRLFSPLRANKLFEWSNSLEQMPGSTALQRTLYYLAIAMQILACLSAVFFRWMESTSLIAEAQSVWEMWVISFYWVLTCLSTVGFGDIFPLHDVTRIYSLVVMVFSIYMNVYLLSSGIAPALQKGVIQQKIDEKKAKLAAVLQFYKVPWGLQKQVCTIYPNVLEASMHDMQEVSELPEYLQEQIYTHIKLNLLHAVPLLKNASDLCQATIATRMTRILVPPAEYLMRQDEEGDCMFFLVRGMVEMLVKDEHGIEKLDRTLTEGSWFGEAALLNQGRRVASARAITVCCLFRLEKKTFYQVLNKFPEFGEGLKRTMKDRPVDRKEKESGGVWHAMLSLGCMRKRKISRASSKGKVYEAHGATSAGPMQAFVHMVLRLTGLLRSPPPVPPDTAETKSTELLHSEDSVLPREESPPSPTGLVVELPGTLSQFGDSPRSRSGSDEG